MSREYPPDSISPSAPDDGLGDADTHSDCGHGIATLKGKGRATDEPDCSSTDPCYLSALPPELIDYIFSFLPPTDLAVVSATCRDLYRLATTDHLWQPLVQANVPGSILTSPAPCASFRDLYAAHDPRWFLPKYKLWICDRELTGKLIVARYDPRTGNIEGYQLLATSSRTTFHQWHMDDDVIVHSFEPSVKLHIDRPIIRLSAAGYARNSELQRDGVTITRIPQRTVSLLFTNGVSPTRPSRSNDVAGLSSRVRATNRFAAETPMMPSSGYRVATESFMHSNFILARPVSPSVAANCLGRPFPYGFVWPPPAIPAQHRVAGVVVQSLIGAPGLAEGVPSCRAEMSDHAFRIRTWLEMRAGAASRAFRTLDIDPNRGAPAASATGIHFNEPMIAMDVLDDIPQQLREAGEGSVGMHIGEDIATYATLDPELYTPTPQYPYRGIWVGDYSGHGCEFLLIHQPERVDDDFDPDSIVRLEGEADEEYAQRKTDETVNRGRLEAIKLTGDPNVPRGEYTFIAKDLGPGGFVSTVQDPPFRGARVVKSEGHIADTGFSRDNFIPTQLILISHDRLAQYWLEFGHMSFFERVNIDDYIAV